MEEEIRREEEIGGGGGRRGKQRKKGETKGWRSEWIPLPLASLEEHAAVPAKVPCWWGGGKAI
jgi:hypothetical protein